MEFTGERYVPCKETENQPIEREHWQRYYFAQNLFDRNSTVLDIASGEGYGSDFLAQKLKYVIGIDISEEAVTYSSKKYIRDNLHFLKGSISEIPLKDHSVDGIVSFETIEHVYESEQLEFLKESKRILKPNGMFLLSCPNKKIASDFAYELWGYTNIYHKKEYEIDSFKYLLKKFYKNVKLLYQRTENNLVLSDAYPESLKVIWGERKDNKDTQNIIAICSDVPIPENISNLIILDIDGSYLSSQKNYSDLFKANTENLKTISNCQNQLTQLHDKTDSLQSDLKQKLLENDTHKAEISVLKCQNSEQNERILTLKEEINNYRQLSEQRQEQIDNYRQLAEQRQEEINRIAEEKIYLQQELEMRMEQLKLMENSKSWRITKPLRALINVFKSS